MVVCESNVVDRDYIGLYLHSLWIDDSSLGSPKSHLFLPFMIATADTYLACALALFISLVASICLTRMHKDVPKVGEPRYSSLVFRLYKTKDLLM